MRILFINPVGQVGGAERVLLDCVASIGLAKAGHEIHLLLMDEGPLGEEARLRGAVVRVVPAPEAIRRPGAGIPNRHRRRAVLQK